MAENTDPKLQRVEMSAEEYAAFQAFKAEKARQEANVYASFCLFINIRRK